MAKILISPGKYVQGSGELSRLNTYTEKLGKQPLILITESGYKRIGSTIEKSFKESGTKITFDYFNRECCKKEINRIIEVVDKTGCDIIVGVGGGKALDTAKAVAFYKKIPVVICPTIASSDAPCSALSVIYTEKGVFEEYLFLPLNPNVVVMDIDAILSSPTRLTISGIGDALATYFEARATERKCATTCAGGTITLAASALAKLCYETLIAEGVKARYALEAGVCTPAVEKIVEANTLLSGIGFESGGLAAAHAIHNGFTVLEDCHHLYHGEKVAFGTLTQLVMENLPIEELEEVFIFCAELGLPVTLEQLGIKEVTTEKIMAVAKAATVEGETIHNMPFPVTADTVYAAIMTADAMGKEYSA